MATPAFVWDSSVNKSILAFYNSVTGLPVFMDETTGLPVDVTDRAARLLGVVYGSQGQKIQQKATTFETVIDVASQSLTALKVSATAAANLVTNPIFVQLSNGAVAAAVDAANTARTTGTIVQAVQGVDAAGAVLSTAALALDASVNTLLKPANTLAGVTTVTNLAQQGGVPISLNTGVRDTGTQRVTIATNDLVPISAASLPLPTGASTEATLALIKAKTDNIPAQGQALMAASTPVTIASNQTAVPVSGTVTANLGTIADVATQTTLALIKAKTDNIDVATSTLAKESTQLLQPQAATTPTLYAVTLTLANTEYSQALPANTKILEIRCRATGYDVRYAFVTGKVAAPTDPYRTLSAGQTKTLDKLNLTGQTLYLACGTAGQVVEIEAWT